MPLLPTTGPVGGGDQGFDILARPEASVRHIDDAAIAAVTNLYREIFAAGGAILDLMSGWVSHLPPEISYARVVGVGISACELAENPFLDEWRVQDLNRNPCLPFATAEFDGAAICVSIQHLLIVTFSNCCLPTRAIACWHLLDDAGHLCLIAHNFAEAGNWTDIRCLDRTPAGGGDPLYAVIGRSLGPAPPVGDDD